MGGSRPSEACVRARAGARGRGWVGARNRAGAEGTADQGGGEGAARQEGAVGEVGGEPGPEARPSPWAGEEEGRGVTDDPGHGGRISVRTQ